MSNWRFDLPSGIIIWVPVPPGKLNAAQSQNLRYLMDKIVRIENKAQKLLAPDNKI